MIDFQPKIGQVLTCDFNTGSKIPEMVKKRPVVVVSRRRRYNNRLCTVVPISRTKPNPVEPFHCQVPEEVFSFWPSDTGHWVKCDMVNTVAYDRLDRLMVGKKGGNRMRVDLVLPKEFIEKIQECVRHALSL